LLVEPDEPDEADMNDPTVIDTIEGGAVPDDRLRLIFTCCHPALSREAQVALTLRLICGVSTA
jgi:RNA polymerase sigma-70 factor, ECF subfamily